VVSDPKKTFLVTSQGRSGTVWLSHALRDGAVRGWEIVHEPKNYYPFGGIKGNLGVVDGSRRHNPWLCMEKDTKLGIILRRPHDLTRSAIARNPEKWKGPRFARKNWRNWWLPDLIKTLAALDSHVQKDGVIVIRFELMVTDDEYLWSVAHGLGINEFDVEKVDFSPKNSSPIGEIPAAIQDEADSVCNWFTKKYWDADGQPIGLGVP